MKFNKKTMQKIGFGVFVVAAALMVGNVAMASDSGVWTSMEVSGKVSKNLTLTVAEELRFGDVTDLVLVRQHTDIGLSTEVTNGVTVGAGYRNVSTGEQRASVSLGLRLLRGTLNVDSLSKLELRDGDTFRARTGLDVTTTVMGLNSFVSDELFVDDTGVTGNRAMVGVTRSLTDVVGVRAFYLLDSVIGDTTTNTHILGVGLRVSL